MGCCVALPCVVAKAKPPSTWRLPCSFTTVGMEDLSSCPEELQRWAAYSGWTSVSFGKKPLPEVIHAVFAAAVFLECTCFISWPSCLLLERS